MSRDSFDKAGVEHAEDVNDDSKSKFYALGLDKSNDERTGEDREISDYIAKFLGISESARENDAAEKTMSLRQGLKSYPKAVLWSFFFSTAIISQGLDTQLLTQLYALPAFCAKFGVLGSDGAYEIPAKWQTSLSMCTNVGEVIGLQFGGYFADRVGYRWTLIISLMFVNCFVFITFFAQNCPTLAVGEILLGIPWGAFQTLTVSYATEVCPMVLRFYLTTYVNSCWVIGQLISSGILRSYTNSMSQWAYRVPFACQWIFPTPLIIGVFFAPESPWLLVRHNKLTDAKASLLRLMSKSERIADIEPFIDAAVSKMKITVEQEMREQKGASYWECFKGTDGRRTMIASMVWAAQNITGVTLMTYSTYFYEKAGLSTDNSFTFSIIQYCLGIIGTIVSWFLNTRFGRYQIYFGGLVIQLLLLVIIGGLGCTSSNGASWAIGSLMLVYTFVYDSGIGPVCYCLVPELPSARLRTKTVVIARNCYNLMGIINAIWTPYMLNSSQWNWGAKSAFFWCAWCIGYAIWMYFQLPETKGRTFAELDELFRLKVKARDFATTEVDPYEANNLMNNLDKQQIADIVDAQAKDDDQYSEVDA